MFGGYENYRILALLNKPKHTVMLQDTPNIPDYAKLKKVRAGLYYYDSVSIEKEKPGNWVVCNLTTGDVKYECKTFGQAKKLVEIDCGLKYGYNG